MILAEDTVPPYLYRRGHAPLVVSMPHVGTFVPPSIARRLEDIAAQRPDTDWHLPRLYDFLGGLDATVVRATHSRYVVDLNRPPDDTNLYPGQDTTGLVPVDTFARAPLYREGRVPDSPEIERRRARIWRPYHARLATEIERVRAEHGTVVLWDAHSILSEVPRLFRGRLKDLNLGMAGGTSCDAGLSRALTHVLEGQDTFTWVVDGRFRGGHITRSFGQPASGVHAVQLEMAVALYGREQSPYPFDEALAARVRPVLRALLETAVGWASAARPQ